MVELARRDTRREHDGHEWQDGGTLPIVAVSGRWGKTTTVRLLEAMLRQQYPGRSLALWIDQGVYVNGRRQAGELIPWGEALRALAGGELDLALQELDARTVNAVGLPAEAYTLAIVTSFCGNDEACLLDERAAIEREAQAVVARAVHPAGALVLNADDLAVVEGGEAASAERIYYGASRRNPVIKEHLAAGGKAVCISSGMIVLCAGRHSQPVLPVRDVALALGGAIVFQVQNALAAVAAAWRLGVPPGRMAAALRAFTSAPTSMPGACNQFRIGAATVIVDQLRDAFSARALARGIRKVRGAGRRVVLLPATPDVALDREALAEVGRVLGHSFDLVLLHQPPGRPEGDAGAALRAGVALNPVPPMTLTLPGEAPALEKLLRVLHAGDVALVLASDLALVLRTLLTYRPVAANSLPPTGGRPAWPAQ
jgi:cyanophycin synthetase